MKPMIILGARIYGGFDVQETDAIAAVKKTKVPILIIHGDGDTFVPISMSLAVRDANPQMVTHHTIAGAEHGISYLVDTQKYKDCVADFMRSLPN
jgi:pimeloyl-ACP methyl ester carboxylesterase